MTRCLSTLLLATALLTACGGDSRPLGAGGTAGGVAGEPISTDLPIPSRAPKNRFELANGCFAVQSRGTQRFVSTGGVQPAADAVTLAAASGFTFKATALGRYALFDPQSRWLDATSPADALAGAGLAAASAGGQQLSGIGDVLVLAAPLGPAGNAVNGVGAGLASGGQTAAMALTSTRTVSLSARPTRGAEWRVEEVQGDAVQGFHLINHATGLALALGDSGDVFDFVPTAGCAAYPEVQLNARGTPFKGRNPDGTVFGYAETHMHLGGSEALGGRIGYGSPFATFGVIEALENCAIDHGPNGAIDAVDATVNPTRMFLPPHETQGWPSFKDWPAHGSNTHHQTYYLWLKRTWMGGLRFMVNHLVANEVICQVWPVKGNDCNEMQSIVQQRQLTLDLVDYIDAQEGGPGKGFLRPVYTPQEARRVIEDGKLAMIFGTENEKIFDCGEFLDQPECTLEHINSELDRWYDLGLRAIFPIHLFDNALGGTRLTEEAALNVLYQGGNLLDTGHPFATIPCEEADAVAPGEAQSQSRGIIETVLAQVTGLPPAPPLTGCLENARGLTELGDAFVNAMIDRGMMIETDHSGTLSRKRILDIAASRGVGVLSGHTGFVSEARDTRRILAVGGIVSNLPDEPAPVTVAFIKDLAEAYRAVHGSTERFATGLGCDINGLHEQPAPRPDAASNPLVYPFQSYDGRVTFERQVSGERVFDINTDGVAHYGLYPDFIADMQREPDGEQALQFLFRSAEAYLQFWENAQAKRQATGRTP